jgi:hypothetical protein
MLGEALGSGDPYVELARGSLSPTQERVSLGFMRQHIHVVLDSNTHSGGALMGPGEGEKMGGGSDATLGMRERDVKTMVL